MNKLVLIIFLFIATQISSQITKDQEVIISKTLIKKINWLRKQKGLHLLESNNELAESAKLQANFMSKNNDVNKNQPDDLFKTTTTRVKYHSQDFDSVAENIIKTRAIAPPFNTKKLNFIASMIFNTWRKSSDATKNMISNEFVYTGFGITYNVELKQFFLSNVFGKKRHKVPNQLSKFAFGIKENKSDPVIFNDKQESILNDFSNNLYIEANEVFLTVTDTSNLSEIINSENDGLAVDLISEDQIQCGYANKLDASPIYNGLMLKPIYKNQIFSTIGSKKISLGKVPDAIKNKKLVANLIVLKNNASGKYILSNNPIKDNYDILLPVALELEKPYIDLRNQGIFIAKEIFFDFKTSEYKTEKYNEANFDLNKVHSFSIKSYTSVDGSESANTVLQNKRAAFIKQHIGDKLGFSLEHVKIRIDARENWKLYDYQLKLYGHNNMLAAGKSQKRAYANGTLKNSWDKQFNEQRKSKIITFQHGYWNRNNKQHGFYNLLNGLITNDDHLVNKSLIWLYNKKDVDYDLDKDYILDRLLTNENFVQNVSALFQKNIDNYDLSYVVYFLNNWLNKSETLTEDAQKNLLSLYTTTSLKLLEDWNEDNKNLSRIVHPDNVEQLFKVYKAKAPTNSLFLNYHIARIEYFNKIKDESKIKESFDFIMNNYNDYTSTTEDKIQLASFFNKWKHYKLSNNILIKEYRENKITPEGILLLAKTIGYTNKLNLNDNEIKKINSEALNLNKDGWCNWMKNNFQKMTDNTIKQLYCASCNN